MSDLRSPQIYPPAGLKTETILKTDPERITVPVLGLELAAYLWGDKSKPVVILIHGTKDHARSWDWTVAGLLPDYCVVTVDLRGHGDSGRAPGGGYDQYNLMADVAALFSYLQNKVGLPGPYNVVGHSLGGNIALNVTAAYPECVSRLIVLEGLGASQAMFDKYAGEPAHTHLRTWLERTLSKNERKEKRFATPEEGVQRMAGVHKNLRPDQAEYLALHGMRQYTDGWGWKHDPLIGFHLPTMTPPEQYLKLFASIRCPILLMYGEKSWASNPAQDGRLEKLQNASLKSYPQAGHWLHHDAFDAFIADVREFLAAG